MIDDRIRHFESLLEKGLFVDAMAEINAFSRQISFDNESNMPAILSRLNRLMDRADVECATNPAATRQKLLQLIQGTESFPVFESCVDALLRSGDFSTLISCRTMDVTLSRDGFKGNLGHTDYIDTVLLNSYMKGGQRDIGVADMFGSLFSMIHVHPGYLLYRRQPGGSDIPTYRAPRRLRLDATLFAAGYDPHRDRFILTLSQEDRVIGVNAKTLDTEAELHSPEHGVRGLGIHAGARRGFFAAEFENVIYSFDLDSFEIRKMIEGFSIRPERIYLDADTNTLVTGNLGLSWGNEYYLFSKIVPPSVKGLGGRAVTVVDTTKEEVTGTLPAGLRPTAVAISGKYIIAGNFWDNTVFIYDRSDTTKAVVVTLPSPTSLDVDFELRDKHTGETIKHKKGLYSRMVEGTAILDGRGWILVACYDVCVMAIIDIGTAKVTDYISVLDLPFDVVVDAKEKYAYVSCHESDMVSIVDLDLKREVGRIEVGPSPVDMTLAGEETLLVPDGQGVTVVDLGEAKKSLGLQAS